MAPSTRSSAPSNIGKKQTPRVSTGNTTPTTSLSSTHTTPENPTTKPLQPIQLHQHPDGQVNNAVTASILHTVSVPALCFLAFSKLVANPIATLQQMVVMVALFQTVYMMTALPVAGSDDEIYHQSKAKKRKQSENGGATFSERAIAILFSHTLTLLLTFPALFLLTLLLGAPLTSHLPQTALFALLLAMLTTPPLFYTRGVSASAWREICSITAPFDECFGGAVGALVGAWVGAVPIPLDWDREWQAWPVTVVVGAVGGWVLGRVVGGTVARGGRLKWAE